MQIINFNDFAHPVEWLEHMYWLDTFCVQLAGILHVYAGFFTQFMCTYLCREHLSPSDSWDGLQHLATRLRISSLDTGWKVVF